MSFCCYLWFPFGWPSGERWQRFFLCIDKANDLSFRVIPMQVGERWTWKILFLFYLKDNFFSLTASFLLLCIHFILLLKTRFLLFCVVTCCLMPLWSPFTHLSLPICFDQLSTFVVWQRKITVINFCAQPGDFQAQNFQCSTQMTQ